jgi:hypothetical protein
LRAQASARISLGHLLDLEVPQPGYLARQMRFFFIMRFHKTKKVRRITAGTFLERLLDRETTTSSFRMVLSHYDVRSMTRHRELGVFVDDLLRADFANSQSAWSLH